MEIPKAVQMMTHRVDTVRTASVCPPSESGGRGGKIKMCCSGVVQIWAASVL